MTDAEFKDILLPCYRRMYAVAYAILRNADDASDAVQDAVSALWQRRGDLPVPDNSLAFCCRTMRNSCIDRLRIDSRRYFDNIDSADDIAAEGAADSLIAYNSAKERITGILSGFKEKQRKILVLNIFSQLTTSEISSILGESEENVRTILCRGRRKIKEYFER